MKTPYDTVLRTRRRELDQVKTAIAQEAGRLTEIDGANHALREEVARELRMAGSGPAISLDGWLRRKRDERAKLQAQHLAAAEQIELLRVRAAETYGPMRAVEQVADRFRHEALRKKSRAEQQMADELGTIRFLRQMRKTRTAPKG